MIIFAQEVPAGFESVFTALTGQAGVIALSIFVIYAGYKGWWVWGRDHSKLEDRLAKQEEDHREEIAQIKAENKEASDLLRQELQEWKKVAMTGLRAAEKAVLNEEIRKGGHHADLGS